MSRSRVRYDIFLYIPNLIGYVRLLMLVVATFSLHIDAHISFIVVYIISAILDATDGWAARTYNQCSAFGAWFDVVIDNTGRTLLWTRLSVWGFWIASLEWLTFVCNHSLGAQWREGVKNNLEADNSTPTFVAKVMEKGFKTPMGTLAISGLHVLPIWLYAINHDIFVKYFAWLPACTAAFGFYILLVGRLLCLVVELWCIWIHIKCMLNETPKSAKKEKLTDSTDCPRD